MIEAAERFQAIENVYQNGSLVDKILPSNVSKNGSFGHKILPSNVSQNGSLVQLSDSAAVGDAGQRGGVTGRNRA